MIVDSVATALRLDGDERVHLDRLVEALAPGARRKRRPSKPDTVSPGIQVMLDSLRHLPAIVIIGRLDIVATNELGRALYASHFNDRDHQPNMARFLFLDEERVRQVWPEWEKLADDVVAILRVQAGPQPQRSRAGRTYRPPADAQRRVPHPVGRQQRPRSSSRYQDLQPFIDRPARPPRRNNDHQRRCRPHHHRLHPATRLAGTRRPATTRRLERRHGHRHRCRMSP